MVVPVVEAFVSANEKYAASFTKGSLPMPPGRKVAVLACMDARLDPARALGLEEGDAHVIRNAGGLPEDAFRSLVISQQLLGTEAVVIIQHTDCGMLTFSDEVVHQKLKGSFDADPSDLRFHPFSDVEASVKRSVKAVRDYPFIPRAFPIYGFIYDVKNGKLSLVDKSE